MSNTITLSPSSPVVALELDSEGRNALHRAAAEGKTEVVRLLAQNRNLLESRDTENSDTPLLLAAYFGHRKACEILLEAGANRKAVDKDGRNVLHCAAVLGQTEIMHLFAGDSDLREARDTQHNDTPLLLAAYSGHRKICEMLLEAGANRNALDKNGRNVLHCAATQGKTEVVRLFAQNRELREAGDAENHITPLHLAAYFGHRETCKILLRAGANREVQSNDGYTALALARHKKHADVVRLLSNSKPHSAADELTQLRKEVRLMREERQRDKLFIRELQTQLQYLAARTSEGKEEKKELSTDKV